MLPPQPLTDRQLRWFGISLSGLVLVLGMLISWRWQTSIAVLVASILALILSTVFYAAPSSRRPIHRAFSICVYPIQFVATVLILGIVYFGIVTPIGMFLRLRRYDPLNRKGRIESPTNTTESFWVKRDPPPPDERYFKAY